MNKNVKNKKSFNMNIKNISKVKLDKNDVVVIHLSEVISMDAINDFDEYLKKCFPNNKTLFIHKCCRLNIISKEEEDYVV